MKKIFLILSVVVLMCGYSSCGIFQSATYNPKYVELRQDDSNYLQMTHNFDSVKFVVDGRLIYQGLFDALFESIRYYTDRAFQVFKNIVLNWIFPKADGGSSQGVYVAIQSEHFSDTGAVQYRDTVRIVEWKILLQQLQVQSFQAVGIEDVSRIAGQIKVLEFLIRDEELKPLPVKSQ